MSENKKQLYIGISAAILCVIVFVILTKADKNNTETPLEEAVVNTQEIQAPVPSPETDSQKTKPVAKVIQKSPEEKTENTQSATVLAGGTIIQIEFAPNTTFYKALVEARDAGKLVFAGKNYPGLGFFVTDIGTLHAGGRNNLLYDINGKEATVGVSAYTLKDGDIIEWKLE